MSPVVSVIVPIYNTEKYLKKCLESIINQTYMDIEIICINDGSTDKSLDILKQYKIRDNRIQIINIKNHGVSFARNLGISRAIGEYIIFVDSDDYIDPHMCEDYLKNMCETKSDLVCGGKKTVTTRGVTKLRWVPKQTISTSPINDYKQFTHYRVVTQKMFKASIIKNNNLLFDTNFNYGEDCLFLINYLTHCNIITGIQKIYYTITINNSSLSRNIRFQSRRKKDRARFEGKIQNIIKTFTNDLYNSKVKTMNTENMDFVYLIKPGDLGTDLRYSLRSIAKHFPNNKIWIVGYKPSWVTNVNYLPIKEENKKWKNLVNDLIEACKCEEISENFIYMNDDFFAVNPTVPLEVVIDGDIGLLDKRIKVHEKSKTAKTGWQKAFKQTSDLLEKIKVEKPYYNYEAHLPLMINKQKFLEVMALQQVQDFIKTPNVLHYRTLYKNYDRPEKLVSIKDDVKVLLGKDTTEQKISVCGWLSCADGVVGNNKFYKFNSALRSKFSKPCVYEEEYYRPKKQQKTTNLPYKTNKYF